MSWYEAGRGLVMTPSKQAAMGIGRCVPLPGSAAYRLTNGRPTRLLAATLALLSAEAVRGRSHRLRARAAHGYRLVRRHNVALMHGFAWGSREHRGARWHAAHAPAYLQHSVDANTSGAKRVSISFNVMFSSFTERLSKPLW
jgi:hypothetical protein